MLCFYSGETITDEDEKPVLIGNITKHLGKKVIIIPSIISISISYILVKENKLIETCPDHRVIT